MVIKALIAIFISALACYGLLRPNFVIVDMTRAIALPAKSLANSKLNKNKQAIFMTRFAKLLPKIIDTYAHDHHVMVISANILANPNKLDITYEVVKKTLAACKHEI